MRFLAGSLVFALSLGWGAHVLHSSIQMNQDIVAVGGDDYRTMKEYQTALIADPSAGKLHDAS